MSKVKYPKGRERSKLLRGVDYIDYKDVDLLSVFVDMYGKIVPRCYSGLSLSQQKELACAIKRARFIGLMPFVK